MNQNDKDFKGTVKIEDTTPTQRFEEKFDKEFGHLLSPIKITPYHGVDIERAEIMQEIYNNLPKSLKSFFLSELSLQKQELVERLEKKKRIMWSDDNAQHIRNIQNNETLEEAITIIKQ